jgi:ABC-2 type transport system permease protein
MALILTLEPSNPRTFMISSMRGLGAHLRIALRLMARNRMALLYGYLFPVIFLLSFALLYRSEDPLLVRHMGELLTVAVLGTACFGLPTTLVSERERGVWRRYRLTPVPTSVLVMNTLLARYVVVLGALLVQLVLAMAIGRWVPAHPLHLFAASSVVTFSLLGAGLVLAALANTVTAAQALGQCLFLPMLIIGGVAVQPDRLPEWILPVTAFLPGRYAVETLQACVSGNGLGDRGFPLTALVVMGAASAVAGARLFRWDSEIRLSALTARSWLLVAVASWLVVGGMAVRRGELSGPSDGAPSLLAMVTPLPQVNVGEPSSPVAAPSPATGSPAATPSPAGTTGAAEPWRALTQFDFAALPIDQIPPDDDNVSPIANDDEAPVGSSAALLKTVVTALPAWAPGHVKDPVQRVRNYLLILAVADFAQSPIERFLPAAVLAHMLREFPPRELAQLLCWVALHADEGEISALDNPLLVDLGSKTLDRGELRTRTYYYGVKLTRRIVGL